MPQTLLNETEMDRQSLAYTLLFIPMEWNYEGFIDEYGSPVFTTPRSMKSRPTWRINRYRCNRQLAKRSLMV